MNDPDHDPAAELDRLLDRVARAVSDGDPARARELVEQVLAGDVDDADAEGLLDAPTDDGEIRRLTVLFIDVVDSTVLSAHLDPEPYRKVLGTYRELVSSAVEHYDGYIRSTSGDGILAVFGHPRSHEDDVRRAVHAGLEMTQRMVELGRRTKRRLGVEVAARVAVHRGLVYIDRDDGEVYGFTTNLAARLQTLAEPNSVVVSEVVERLVCEDFELSARPAASLKGVEKPVTYHQVVGERADVESRRSTGGSLVGRHDERDRLVTCWARTRPGGDEGPHAVALRGEPGVGKTRLATFVCELVEEAGGTVVELAGSPLHGDAGFHPIRALLERRCAIPRDADAAERLRLLTVEVRLRDLDPDDVVPRLAPVLGIPPEAGYVPVPVEGHRLHDEIASAICTYVGAVLAGTGGLLRVEDHQWLDESTRGLVAKWIAAEPPGVMTVVTVRAGTTGPSGSKVELIELAPLGRVETDDLVRTLDPTLPPELVDEVWRRSDGIPLYVEQLVRDVRDAPERPGLDGHAEAAVPEALYEPLVARLRDRANTAPVAAAAATIGRRVDPRLLASVVDLDEEQVDAAILELTDANVLDADGTDGELRFHHEMLREVAYELQTPSARRSLHGRVADALVAGRDVEVIDWNRVSDHYERAERHAEAGAAFGRAAAEARRRGALGEARSQLSRAVEHVTRSPAGPDRDRLEIGLRLERGFLAIAAEGNASPEAASDFERCMSLCEGDVRGDDMFHTLIALWGYYTSRADLDHAVQVLELLAATLSDDRAWFLPENRAGFGMVAWFRGEYTAAHDQLEAATSADLSRTHDIDADWYLPNDPVCSMHTHLALARVVRGDLAGAEIELVESADRAAGLAYPQGPFSLAYNLSLETWMRFEAEQFDRAGEHVELLASHAERHGLDAWSLVAATQRATHEGLTSLRTDGTDPTVLATQARMLSGLVDTWLMVGLKAFITYYYAVAARLLGAAGLVDEALARLDDAQLLAAETGMRFYDAETMRLRAALQPNVEQAAADRACALEIARAQGATIFELRVAMDLDDQRHDGGAAALRDAIGRFPRDSTWPGLRAARAHVR